MSNVIKEVIPNISCVRSLSLLFLGCLHDPYLFSCVLTNSTTKVRAAAFLEQGSWQTKLESAKSTQTASLWGSYTFWAASDAREQASPFKCMTSHDIPKWRACLLVRRQSQSNWVIFRCCRSSRPFGMVGFWLILILITVQHSTRKSGTPSLHSTTLFLVRDLLSYLFN